ncbi:ribosomal protein bL12 [Candidatus Vidania fulgoroideorum]
MKIKKIFESIVKLNTLEIFELSKMIEKKFSVVSKTTENKVKKNICNIILESSGINKISIIRLIKEMKNIGLKESKNLTDNLPKVLFENITLDKSKEIISKFEDLGAKLKLECL